MLRTVLLSVGRQASRGVVQGLNGLEWSIRHGAFGASGQCQWGKQQLSPVGAAAVEVAPAWCAALPALAAEDILTAPGLVLMGAPKKRVRHCILLSQMKCKRG